MTDWHSTFDFDLGPDTDDLSFVLGFEFGRVYAMLQTGFPVSCQVHFLNRRRLLRLLASCQRTGTCYRTVPFSEWADLEVDGAA